MRFGLSAILVFFTITVYAQIREYTLDATSESVAAFIDNKEEFKEVESLIITNGTEDIFTEDLISALRNLKKLDVLEFEGYSGKLFPAGLPVGSIKRITFRDCSGPDSKKLFRTLGNLSGLDSLEFINCNISKLPSSAGRLQNLRSITITGEAENFNANAILRSLSSLPNLEHLSLSGNDLTSLPETIGLLTSLETLDLSDNRLTDLPDGISQLTQLKSIDLANNDILDPLRELIKIRTNSMEYIALTTEMTVTEYEQIERWFPSAELDILPVESEEEEEEKEEEEEVILREEELTASRDTVALPSVDKGRKYNAFRTGEESFRILSEAYIHYPRLFAKGRFDEPFDSLLFEERYQSLDYVNTNRIQANRDYNKIALHIYRKGKRGEVWFDFSQHGWIRWANYNPGYIKSELPEMRAFNNMVWVSAEPISKREFKSTYVYQQEKKGLFKKRHYYTDLRLFLQDDEKNFTLQLKDLNGFTDIAVYPRDPNKDRPLEKSQELYVRQYISYSKTLERRERKFHRRLHKNAAAYASRKKIWEDQRWSDFQSAYMSNVEKQMSKEEWLEYYDKVISNERKALNSGEANVKNITRTLDLDGFKIISRSGYKYGSKMRCVNAIFKDSSDNQLVIEEVLVINKNQLQYATYEGSLGISPVKIYFEDPANSVVFVRMRNGETAVIREGLDKLLVGTVFGDYVTLTVETLKEKFSSVQQTRNLMGL